MEKHLNYLRDKFGQYFDQERSHLTGQGTARSLHRLSSFANNTSNRANSVNLSSANASILNKTRDLLK